VVIAVPWVQENGFVLFVCPGKSTQFSLKASLVRMFHSDAKPDMLILCLTHSWVPKTLN